MFAKMRCWVVRVPDGEGMHEFHLIGESFRDTLHAFIGSFGVAPDIKDVWEVEGEYWANYAPEQILVDNKGRPTELEGVLT